MSSIVVYTDGACKGNPGPGGWGSLIIFPQKSKIIPEYEVRLKGSQANTTNNRMELSAVIHTLEFLYEDTDVHIHTDSKYVLTGCTEWIHGWKRNNWKTKNKGEVKNIDLWVKLDQEIQKHLIKWTWVRGHSGNRGNEIADELANEAIDEMLRGLK